MEITNYLKVKFDSDRLFYSLRVMKSMNHVVFIAMIVINMCIMYGYYVGDIVYLWLFIALQTVSIYFTYRTNKVSKALSIILDARTILERDITLVLGKSLDNSIIKLDTLKYIKSPLRAVESQLRFNKHLSFIKTSNKDDVWYISNRLDHKDIHVIDNLTDGSNKYIKYSLETTNKRMYKLVNKIFNSTILLSMEYEYMSEPQVKAIISSIDAKKAKGVDKNDSV